MDPSPWPSSLAGETEKEEARMVQFVSGEDIRGYVATIPSATGAEGTGADNRRVLSPKKTALKPKVPARLRSGVISTAGRNFTEVAGNGISRRAGERDVWRTDGRAAGHGRVNRRGGG